MKIDLEMLDDLVTEDVTTENTDRNLLQQIGNDLSGWVVGSLPYMTDEGFVGNSGLQAVYNAETCRGGVVVVGSGSSGHTSWTDASSLANVIKRHETDTMSV